jgi:large subunit ribosomal protein L29
MKARDLRQLSKDELAGKIRQWRDELFRSRFKTQSAETRDTSVLKKLRREIARANTVFTERNENRGISDVKA